MIDTHTHNLYSEEFDEDRKARNDPKSIKQSFVQVLSSEKQIDWAIDSESHRKMLQLEETEISQSNFCKMMGVHPYLVM